MSDQQSIIISQAARLIKRLMSATDDKSKRNANTDAANWLRLNEQLDYVAILRKVHSSYDASLYEILLHNETSSDYGMRGFVSCGDPLTIDVLVEALKDYCHAHSKHQDIRVISENDTVVSIGGFGYLLLSVNSRAYAGVPHFSAGYLRREDF